MPKIKLLVDAHVFDGAHQGTSTYLKGLYNALVNDSDFEITLLANDLESLRIHFPHKNFRFIQLKSTSKWMRLAKEIPAIIRKNHFDFAHFQYITPFKKECLYINTIHDLLFIDHPQYFPFSYRIIKYITFRLSALNSDVICTVSEYSKRAISKHFKIKNEDIVVTPNAIDLNQYEYSDVKAKYNLNKYLLFVSRFEPRKNHLMLLRSFIELRLYELDYKLVFIGKAKDVNTVEYNLYFKNLNSEQKKSILQLENISPAELNSFYQSTDLFVYPSFAEGFGIPPLEAAVLNCKVLCSNQTALKDFEFFGKYLFNPDDINELKSKIISTLNENDYPFLKIKNEIIERYNWKSIAKDFSDKIKEFRTN